MDSLQRLGWNFSRQQELARLDDPSYQPARVAVEHRGAYGLLGSVSGTAKLAGRLRQHLDAQNQQPCVGDWVAVRPAGEIAIIEALLPRHTLLSRRQAGTKLREQAVASNVDVVFVVSSANRDFNLRRIERYLATAWASGGQPVLVLSKADACEHIEPFLDALSKIATGVNIIVSSAATGLGLHDLRGCIGQGATAAMIGSSGVGKSSLLNGLLGEERQRTREIRVADGKGRHATTRRELIELGDGCLIDTPGMREVGLWDAAVGTERTFGEVEELAQSCRFRDCRHSGEPGCAVTMAAETGLLDEARLASYERLRREQAHLDAQHDGNARARSKQRWRNIHKQQRARRKVDPKLRDD